MEFNIFWAEKDGSIFENLVDLQNGIESFLEMKPDVKCRIKSPRTGKAIDGWLHRVGVDASIIESELG